MKQLVYLDTIARLDHPTFSDLARNLRVSKPSVTAIVGKLLQKGYVEKVRSAEDRRAFYVLMTEKGQALSRLHDNIHRRIAEHFTQALDENETAAIFPPVGQSVEVGVFLNLASIPSAGYRREVEAASFCGTQKVRRKRQKRRII